MDEFEQLRKLIDKFSDERDWTQFHSPKNLAASISIEASELLELFQWTDPSHSELQENSDLRSRVSEELADIVIYCVRFCSLQGIEFASMVSEKIKINEEKYPISLSKGSSKKYNSLEKQD